MEQKTWYVYLLCDPDTEIPFYVGKGSGNRMDTHGSASDYTNHTKRQIIQQIKRQGKQVLRKKIAEFSVERDAYIYEWGMINVYHEHVVNIKVDGDKCFPKRPTYERPDKPEIIRPLTIKEAANMIGISTKTLLHIVERGLLPAYRISGTLKFKRSEVQAYFDARQYKPEQKEEPAS